MLFLPRVLDASITVMKLALLRPFHGVASSACEVQSLPINSLRFCSQNLRLLLSSCEDCKSLLRIHGYLVVSGLEQHQTVAPHLINSYSLFRECDLTRFVFNSGRTPSVCVYNSVIRAYTRLKRYEEALEIYLYMLDISLEPDKYTFTFALKACTATLNVQEGASIRREISGRKLDYDVFIGTGLIDMYSKMGDRRNAMNVFENMPNRDVAAWNAIIGCLSQCCNPGEAMEFFRMMQMERVEPDLVTLSNLVPAVSKLANVDFCRTIHAYVVRRAFCSEFSNGLIDMYSKCGDIKAARLVFNLMPVRNDVSWGTMMAGYVYNGFFLEVLCLFNHMKKNNLRLNKISTINSILAAGEMIDLDTGRKIHDCAKQQGIDKDITIATSVIVMYLKCGELQKAKTLFEKLEEKDAVAWSAFVSACVQSGYYEEALSLFQDLQNEKLKIDLATLKSILLICAELNLLHIGKAVHCFYIKAFIDSDVSTETAMVSMYVKCRCLSFATNLFNSMLCKDVVTWNALIKGYTQAGEIYSTVMIMRNLLLSKIRPDERTMVAFLSVCSPLNDHLCSCIHGQIIKLGFESDNSVNSALTRAYSKCGKLSSAENLFGSTNFVKDATSWNALIASYMHNALSVEAISTFFQMKREKFQPNLVTFLTILPAAACLAALRLGKALHACIIRAGFLSNIQIGNSLIDMYAKCGRLENSEKCFNEMENKNTVSCNAMLAGYARHGQGDSAVELFSLMQESRVNLDSISFLCVLSACRHAGLIKEGKQIFQTMSKKHHIQPKVEHFACMVDLLGRASFFEEALSLIDTMTMKPNASVWGALLGACRMHSNIKLGEVALDHLVKLEPRNPTNSIVLAGLYAESGKQVVKTRSWIGSASKKIPGCSWVEVKNRVLKSEFSVT